MISWEWGRLVRGATFDLGFFVHAIAVTAAIVLAAAGYAALAVAVLAIAAITLIPLYVGRGARLSALGVFYVGLPAVALLWLRSDEPFGFTAVLFVFAVVWSSDTAAYAAGRGIGGPEAVAARVAQQDVGRACRRARGRRRSPAPCSPSLEPEAPPLRLVLARHRRWRSSRRPAISPNRRSSACSTSRMRATSSPATAASWTAWTASSPRPSPPRCWRSPSIRTPRRARCLFGV